jgi:serine/threonine protein kinase
LPRISPVANFMEISAARLHSCHFESSSASLELRAWKAVGRPGSRRAEVLRTLITRAAYGLELSTELAKDEAVLSPVAMPSIRCRLILKEDGLFVETKSHRGFQSSCITIPLLLSDVLCIESVPSKSSDDLKYVIGIAPRNLLDESDEPLFTEAWLICLDGRSNSMDVSVLMQSLSTAGAVRWDQKECFEVTMELGAGGYATVFAGRAQQGLGKAPGQADSSSHQSGSSACGKVAVKRFKETSSIKAVKAVKAEVSKLLLCSGHPSIITFLGLFCQCCEDGTAESKVSWSIVMDLCPHGDLFDYIDTQGSLPDKTALFMMAPIFSALEYVHSKKLVHRDVKAENILLTHNNEPVLADFGIAACVDDAQAMTQACGTPGYAAPEIVTAKRYSQKVDIFAAGVVLYLMLSNRFPFASPDPATVIRKTAACKVKFDKTRFSSVRSPVIVVVKALLEREPRLRPTSAEALLGCLMLLPTNMADDFNASHADFATQKLSSKDVFLLPEMEVDDLQSETEQPAFSNESLRVQHSHSLIISSDQTQAYEVKAVKSAPATNGDTNGVEAIHKPPESPSLVSTFRRRVFQAAGQVMRRTSRSGSSTSRSTSADDPLEPRVTPQGSAVQAVKVLQHEGKARGNRSASPRHSFFSLKAPEQPR